MLAEKNGERLPPNYTDRPPRPRSVGYPGAVAGRLLTYEQVLRILPETPQRTAALTAGLEPDRLRATARLRPALVTELGPVALTGPVGRPRWSR